MAETTIYPCPECGATPLLYDGIVRWSDGPCPPLQDARPRDAFGNTPRGDSSEAAYYHCQQCQTVFIDHQVLSYMPLSLQPENGGPIYIYDRSTRKWQRREWS